MESRIRKQSTWREVNKSLKFPFSVEIFFSFCQHERALDFSKTESHNSATSSSLYKISEVAWNDIDGYECEDECEANFSRIEDQTANQNNPLRKIFNSDSGSDETWVVFKLNTVDSCLKFYF